REQLLARRTQVAQQQPIQTTEQSAEQPTSPVEPEKITTPEPTASSSTSTATVTAAATPPPTNDLAQGQQTGLIAGADAYYRGDYQIAYNLLKPLSDADNPRAKFRMAMMYARGRGVPKSTALARELSRQAFPAIQNAANNGQAWAQADMGSIYEDGLIVLPNITTAVGWYRLAAEQGYPGAQTNLGVLYANGEGVIQDTTEAVAWLQRAASQGDKIARDNLRALGVN
ncbi:MAG: sel1 repeat family protein, partial [Gammaproteobacteria bacterium]|nr:sel1 repeat family protein [Gammaproteobacteria bacterium]